MDSRQEKIERRLKAVIDAKVRWCHAAHAYGKARREAQLRGTWINTRNDPLVKAACNRLTHARKSFASHNARLRLADPGLAAMIWSQCGPKIRGAVALGTKETNRLYRDRNGYVPAAEAVVDLGQDDASREVA